MHRLIGTGPDACLPTGVHKSIKPLGCVDGGVRYVLSKTSRDCSELNNEHTFKFPKGCSDADDDDNEGADADAHRRLQAESAMEKYFCN